jgi:hypothetical protein
MLRKIASECTDTVTCPTVYIDDKEQDTAVIQGYVVTDPDTLAQLGLPAGEAAVRVPKRLLVDAAGRLG